VPASWSGWLASCFWKTGRWSGGGRGEAMTGRGEGTSAGRGDGAGLGAGGGGGGAAVHNRTAMQALGWFHHNFASETR